MHIYRICPGSGSEFVSLHTDPDPTFITQIRIRIRNTGSRRENLREESREISTGTGTCSKFVILLKQSKMSFTFYSIGIGLSVSTPENFS